MQFVKTITYCLLVLGSIPNGIENRNINSPEIMLGRYMSYILAHLTVELRLFLVTVEEEDFGRDSIANNNKMTSLHKTLLNECEEGIRRICFMDEELDEEIIADVGKNVIINNLQTIRDAMRWIGNNETKIIEEAETNKKVLFHLTGMHRIHKQDKKIQQQIKGNLFNFSHTYDFSCIRKKALESAKIFLDDPERYEYAVYKLLNIFNKSDETSSRLQRAFIGLFKRCLDAYCLFLCKRNKIFGYIRDLQEKYERDRFMKMDNMMRPQFTISQANETTEANEFMIHYLRDLNDLMVETCENIKREAAEDVMSILYCPRKIRED